MNSHYELRKQEEARGIDYDLRACLLENGAAFKVEDINCVLAVIEGENDEASWHWILRLENGRYAYLTGWCDYTGWDCQSGSRDFVCDTVAEALSHVGPPGDPDRLNLARQLLSCKTKTWREKMDDEFGLTANS